jgi:hypothetical protein
VAWQVAETIVSASQYCTKPYISCCAAIPCREKHSCHHLTTVLSRFCSRWLSAVPYSVMGLKGVTFHNSVTYQIKCNGWTLEDSKRNLRLVLPTMAGLMKQVCVCTRALLWKCLGKHCHISYHYSALPENFLTTHHIYLWNHNEKLMLAFMQYICVVDYITLQV